MTDVIILAIAGYVFIGCIVISGRVMDIAIEAEANFMDRDQTVMLIFHWVLTWPGRVRS